MEHAEHSEGAGRTLKRIETSLGVFGNRTDIIFVEGDRVRGTSLLECDNPNALFITNSSHFPITLGKCPQFNLFDDNEIL